MIAEKELLSSTISKETLKVQIENGLREGGAEKRNTLSVSKNGGTRP